MKAIKDFEDYYITEDGKVWSNKSHKFLSPNIRAGYLSVTLTNKNGKFSKTIHRLVAETYIPNPKNLPMVNHKDENKFNNHVENLEWCDTDYNNNYGTRNQRIAKINKQLFPHGAGIGGKHPEAVKIAMCDPKDYHVIQTFDAISEACNFLNLNYTSAQPNISAVLNGRRKTAYKYFWKKI